MQFIMNEILVLVVALLPSILLGIYIWWKDPQKEPLIWLVKSFLIGCVICFPLAHIENIIELFLSHLISPYSIFSTPANAFFVAAIPEEGIKLLALWILLQRNPFFDEHIDGIVYAVFIGLGFAAVENVFYLFNTENWISTAIVRSLLAVPGHYAFAVLMGYYYSLYYFVERTKRHALCIFFVPVMIHGIYDSLAMSGNINPYVGFICFFVLIFFCVRIHLIATKKIQTMINKDLRK